MRASSHNHQDTKFVFIQKGTSSQTFYYLLNEAFGNALPVEEKAASTLARGMAREGRQCGQLWGATLAVGAEAYHQGENRAHSTFLAIDTARQLLTSFEKYSGAINCKEISHTDFKARQSSLKYLVGGKAITCLKLADQWAPEAIKIAKNALLSPPKPSGDSCHSCSAMVLRQLGASETEAIMVAGFAGGLGLSGQTCGALGAVIWYKALLYLRQNPDKKTAPLVLSETLFKAFSEKSQGETQCRVLSGRTFTSAKEHSQFMAQGGCRQWLDALCKIAEPPL